MGYLTVSVPTNVVVVKRPKVGVKKIKKCGRGELLKMYFKAYKKGI